MRANRSRRALRRSIFAASLIAALALVAPVSALAQETSPTGVEYDTPVLNVENSGNPGDPGETVSAESASTLPFTGLDLAAFAAIGVGLLATGFVIRRAARPRQQL
jgi:hypothetical protein